MTTGGPFDTTWPWPRLGDQWPQRRFVQVVPNEGPWLQTIGGGKLDLVNPKPEQINPRHVVRVICRLARFGGHTEGPVDEIYSVAQHSREGARAILRDTGREDAAAAFLVHDLHEAYTGDIPTPVRDALCAVAGGRAYGAVVRGAITSLKARLDLAIHERVGVPFPLASDVHAIVKDYDQRMCGAEHRARMMPLPAPYPYIENATPVIGCDLYAYSPGTVEKLFLATAEEYGLRLD